MDEYYAITVSEACKMFKVKTSQFFTLVVSCDEPQDVVVSEHDRLWPML
jgi:hypothetical protein